MTGIKERYSNLSKRDEQYLERALNIAAQSDCKQKHGAIIVAGGRIVGSGLNTFRNQPITNYPSDAYTVHAEINALRSVKHYRQVGKIDQENPDVLVGSKLYVARVNRLGNPGNSRPCEFCSTAIRNAGIKEVIYTT